MPLPPIVYATFSGPVDGQTIGRLFGGLSTATQGGVSQLHLLFESPGGNISDGISLYNFFRGLPLDLHVYNTGAVQSIAVVAFLGAAHRHTSAHATFLFHKSTFTLPNPTTASKYRTNAKALDIEDVRIETILRAHTTLPPKLWRQRATQDLIITASEAIQYGVAHDGAEFVVPAGGQIFNL